jgi:phosphatidylglycerol lysyltransferase
VRYGGRLASALAGFSLILLAGSLWRRKRIGWVLTVLVLSASILVHLAKGLDYEEALLAAALSAALLLLRHHFHARSDPPSVRQGLRAVVAALGFTLGYGVLGFFLLDRHFSVNFSFSAAVRQTVVMFTEFYDPGLHPVTGFGRYFADSIYAIGAGALIYALLMLLRPVLVREPATPAEREFARQIVEGHGRTSVARYTLLGDKPYYFSPGGSSIAYAVPGRVALALGDPIGPREDAAAAIVGFRAFCARNDWRAAFYQVLPDCLEAYRAAGFDALCVGHEAVVDLAEFSLEGKSNRTLRSTMNRFARLGIAAELLRPPLADEVVAELGEISDEWLGPAKGVEKRFSLGYFEEAYMRSSLVMAVRAPTGRLTAFTNLVPEYQCPEVTVDLMRHRRSAEAGTMDFLFVSLFQWAGNEGYQGFSLGLSALAGVGQEAEDPAVERALDFIFQHLNQFYNFRGLHAFKSKFRPRWSPRYLVYPGAAALPAVALALIRADSGDAWAWDFLRQAMAERLGRKDRPTVAEDAENGDAPEEDA